MRNSFVIKILPWAILLAVSVPLVFYGCESSGPVSTGRPHPDWEYLGAPYKHDYIYSIAVTGSGVIYSATHSGVFLSGDRGDTWEKMPGNIPYGKVRVLSAGSEGLVFAGTDKGGIFRSRDGGHTWVEVYQSMYHAAVYAIFLTADDRVCASITQAGVILSSDDGDTWSNTDLSYLVQKFAEGPDTTLYAATNNYVLRLGDDGITWVDVSGNLPDYPSIESIAIDSSGNIFIPTRTGKILTCSRGGTIWTEIYSNPDKPWIYDIALNSTDQIFAIERGGVVISSTDGGAGWSRADLETALDFIVIGPGDLLFTGGKASNVIISDDGGETWTARGMSPGPVLSLAVDLNGRLYAGTSGLGLFRLSEVGVWGRRYVSDYDGKTFVSTIFVRNETELLAGTFREGAIRSRSSGDTWQRVDSWFVFAGDFAVDSTGRVYCAFAGFVHYLDDGTDRWRPIGGESLAGYVYALETDMSGRIIAGTESGIFVLETGGSDWRRAGAEDIDEPVYNICTTDLGNCFAATGTAVYRSGDSYTVWHPIIRETAPQNDFLLADLPGRSIAVAAKGKRIHIYCEYGKPKVDLGDGMPDLWINALAVGNDGTLFAGTDSGVYSCHVPSKMLIR